MSKIKYFEIGSYVTEPQSGDVGKVLGYYDDGKVNVHWVTGNSKGYDIPVNVDILKKHPYEFTYKDFLFHIGLYLIPILFALFVIYLVFK